MSWHKIFGILLFVALFGLLLRPNSLEIAAASGEPAPVAQATPGIGAPVVVKSGGAPLFDGPDALIIRQVAMGTVVQALSRTPTGDWIFVEVERGVQGWLASDRLVSVNPGSLPVYGLPQAGQSAQPAQATAAPTAEPTPKPTATATATAVPTATAAPTAPPSPLPSAAPTNRSSPTIAAQPAMASQPSAVSSGDPFLRVIGVVRSGGATLADGPSGEAVALLPPGEIVTLLQRSEKDDWLEVGRGDSSSGWVKQSELLTAGLAKVSQMGQTPTAPVLAPDTEAIVTVDATTEASASVTATVRTGGSRLNVRSGPGSEFAIVAKADNASSYPALATDNSQEWVQIEIAGVPGGTGWVSARFVIMNSEQ